ncbi:uncharacterized protein LOC119172311 [Rhipicephalus microplus]|uniref:uncharacterized protein LOC119172311 n=1 Tax=Rhipicephalus microplus TaxID=6941 RepID=UPI003F6CC4B7
MSTVFVSKRKRRKKPKKYFGFESTSKGPDNMPPSNAETDLRKLLVHLKTQQEVHQGERQSTDAGNSRQGLDSERLFNAKDFAIPRTKFNYECKRFGTAIGNMRPPKSAAGEDGLKVDEVFMHESMKLKIIELDAVGIMRQLRDALREIRPSEEDDLWKALNISPAQQIVDMHGTITILLDHFPTFEDVYDLFTFVCYPHSDGEVDVLDETATESRNDCGLQDAMAFEGVHQRTSVISSDSNFYDSAGGGGDNKLAACRMKNVWSQVRSLCLYLSRAQQAMQPAYDAEVQTQECVPAGITELKYGRPKHDAQIAGLKLRLNTIRESRVLEGQQNRDKIRTPKQPSPALAGARAPMPRPLFYPLPPHQPKAEEKQHSLPSRQTPPPMSLTRRHSPPRHRQMSIECEELTLVPLPRDEAQRHSPSGQEVRGSSRGSGNHSDLSAVPKNENDVSPSLLAQKVDRLEHELESTCKLLRQANRELARREASLAQLGRHNERLRGRVARLESDVAVYRAASSAATAASSSSSSGEEEDAVAANAEIDVSGDARPTRCCSARDKELLRTLAGIYDKISISGPRKGDSVVDGGKWYAFGKNHRHVGRSLPDAHVLEQVFANFWQEYRSMSSELESCKQVVANQELRIGYLEAQVDATNRIKTNEFFDADVLRKGADNGAVGMNASVRFGENCDIALNGDTCSVPVGGRCAALVNVERRVAEESHLLARLGRLQLDNSRLQVLNREVLTREAAVKKELQRVQNKLSSFKTDLARATKKILGRESSCTFPAEVSLRILLEELASLRRQNGRLQMAHEQEDHQSQQHKDPTKDTACGGLQPVPEESAANGTTVAANPDATAAASALPVNLLEHCVKNADGTDPSNAGVTAGRNLRRWCSEDAAGERPPPDNVPENEYRIWFPRAEVSHEDSTDRASSDWRTFREYRYTECSRAGRLEKTLSVDEVHKRKDSPGTLAAAIRQPTLAFHCVSCSNEDEHKGGSLGEEGKGRCRMLSSTKSELFREHRGQQLSRLIDEDPTSLERSPQPLETRKSKLSQDPEMDETGCCKVEARTSSVCQTNTDKVAFEGDDLAKKCSSNVPSSYAGGMASTPASRSPSDGDFKNVSYLAVSAGVQDASLASVDDEFDDSKCTYVKVDSVDSEVEDENGLDDGKAVTGAPSPDELGLIAEEPEDELEETSKISEVRNSFSTMTHEASKAESNSVLSSARECRPQESLSSKSDIKDSSNAEEKGNGLRFSGNIVDATARLTAGLNAPVDGQSLECHSEDSKDCVLDNESAGQSSHKQDEQKDSTDAALRLDDLSDAETNESETKSVESVIFVKDETVTLPNTNGQSAKEAILDTIVRSSNVKENSLETVEMFGTSDRLKEELILNEKSRDVAKAQEKHSENKEDISFCLNVNDSIKTPKHALVLDSESTSSAGDHETCGAESKSEQFLLHAGDLQEARHAHKDLTESLKGIALKNEHVFSEAGLSHQEELRNFEDSPELMKDSAVHTPNVSDSIEQVLKDASKANVSSVTSKYTFNNEEKASVQVGKEHASTVNECGWNEPDLIASEQLERSSIDVPELRALKFSQLLQAGTLTEESTFESVTRLTSVGQVSEKTQESVNSITDDSPLSRNVARTKKASAGEDGAQRENPDVPGGLKNGVEKILKIGDALKQDSCQSTELRFLTNTEVEAQNILKCFTNDEEPWKRTSKTVSSFLNDSTLRKSVLDDDVVRVTHDVEKRDEHLRERGLKEFRADVVEWFDKLALKDSPGFQAEGASVFDHFQTPNASVNKIQDYGVNVEKIGVTGNEENVPTILADEHHLFKGPQISSVEGQEGMGVMSTVTSTVHEESSLSSSIKVSMLKDVIALNRTDDATSVDDASLQDDNDQGFESLPCDQTLDSQDLNEEQVRHESGNVKDRMPLAYCLDNDSVENDSNIIADKLTVLLEEHVGPEKATPISSQHETTAQTLSTEATDQKNETSPEPDLRSRISTDDADSEGKSVESCVNRIASDEKLRLLSATSSEIEKHEETKLQALQETSGEDYSAVTAKHSITEITVYNGDSKGTHVKGIHENATKTSDPHEIEKSASQQNMQEKEQEAGTQNETSEELASEHSGNQSSGDDNTNRVSKDISVNCSQNIGTPTESIEGDEIFEELLTKKHVNCNSSNEVIEAKEQHFVKESTIISTQSESSLLHETLEGHLSEESVNESTSHSAIAKLEADPSETTLPNIAGHNKESEHKEISEESSGRRTTNSSSSVVDVTEPKALVEELAEHVDSGASVPREVSEGSEGGPPLSRSTRIEITVIKSDIPVRKISDTIVPNDVSMQSELTEVRSDEDPPCHSTGSKDVTMVGDEASTKLRSNDLRTQSKNPDDIASERPVTHLTSDQHATNVMPDLSASEFPEMAVSNELRVQSETVDVLGSEEHSNQSKSNVDVTDGAEEISGGEVPEIVGITETSEISETSGEPVSEVAVNDKTNGQIAKKEPLKAVCEWPETLFNSESSAQSKAPGILASEEFRNHDNTTLEVTKVGEELSVGEVGVTVASTESIWEKKTSGVPGSKEFVEQNTYENITEVNQDPSTWELADETFSSEMSAQSKASDVLSCEQPEKHEKADVDETKLNVGVAASDVPNIAAYAEPAERKEKPEQPASKAPEDENLNDITRSQQDAPAFEWPARAFSRKSSLQFRTPDSLASEKPFCGDSDKDNAKAFVSELPKILVTFDPDDNTIEEFLNEKTSWPGASDTGVTTNASFGELSGTVVSTETSAPCETPEVSASESHANQNITKAELNMFEPGASVSEPPETAALNEASVQSTASGESSREKTRNHINDNWNATTERDISVTVLSEIVTTSNEAVTTCESPEESASEEATPQDITDDASEVKEEIEASEVSEVTMTDDTSLGQGTTPGNEECEEITKESSGDNGVIKAKVETSNELPDITVLDEECVKGNPSEDTTSRKPVNNNTSNKQIDNLDARTSESESANVALGIEVTLQSETTKNLTGGEVVRQSVHDDNGKVEKQMSSNVLRNFTEPDKYSVQMETSDNLATFIIENMNLNGVATTEDKSETADMGSSDILPPNKDSSLDMAAKKSASEENLPKTKRDVEITTINENMPISRVPEISMPSEPILLSKLPPELTSHVGANESIIIQEITHVNAGKSAKETPEVATPNEACVKIGVTEQLTSKENSHRMSVDNEHIKTKLKTSASFLPEISESDNKKVQTPDELPSEKTATGVATETSAQRLLERDETMKGPTSDEPNESRSEVVEACLEIETQKYKNEGIVADGVAAREQVEPVRECTRVKSDIAKRFANAYSCDELDEDNETASTGAESVQSDTMELVRSDDAGHSDSIEEIDKAFKDITGGSLEDSTNEYVQMNDSQDVHVLNEKRDSNREETMETDVHDTSAEQLSLDDFAEDTKKPSLQTSTSGGCVLETVAEKFPETTEGHHTTELAKCSEAVSNSLLEGADGSTSEAPSKGGYEHTRAPEKSSCEATEGHVITPKQFATEELANVINEFEAPSRLTTTRPEAGKGDVLAPEISAIENTVNSSMPSTAEAYNLSIASRSLNYHIARETKDDRSSLLAYAEEVVSTVLSMCVTYLEENDQEWRRTPGLAGNHYYELNTDLKSPSKQKEKVVKATLGDHDKEHGTSPAHSDHPNQGSSGGEAFEPIVPRQSVFEEVVPLADLDINWDPNQATPIISVRAEKAEGPDELLSSTPMSEVENEAVSAAPIDETATICKMTENAEIGVPLNSSEDAGLSQVTEEEHDGDASDHTVSVSKALAADAGSSENQSSTYGRNRNLFPDQVAGQSDQSERMQREEAKPVAAGIVDAASCERPKKVSETRLDSAESWNKDESEEPEHRIVTMEPLKNQESQLNEYLFTESATRVIEKSSGHSPSENKARSGDQGEETEEAEHETAANSFSESSLTTVSVKTEDPAERLSEYSTTASEQESDTVPADEVNKDNSGASNICEADPENVLNNQFNETRSLSTQHTVTGSNNNTEEGHQEATSQSETFQEPAGQSVISRNAEGGHEECDISEEAKKTIVPDSLDMSSQDVYTQVASNDEENKTSELCVDTNDYGSVRQNERYIFKHESATAVDNDMESFGALSTVYESSLEYVRCNTDEHISDSEFSKTVSGDYDTVCEATNSKTVSFKHSTKIGDMFEIGKHSDEQKSQQNFKESVHFLSNAGGKNESVRDIAKAINDPAVAPAFVHEKPADPIGKHVDSNYLIANEIQIDTQKKKETNVSEASHGWANTREASKKNAAVIKDMDVPLRSREVGEKQNILQSNSSQYVTKDTSDEKAPRGLRTRSLDEEYTERQEKERHGLKARSLDENIKQYATAIRDDSTDSVIPEVHKTNIANSHESLQKNRMAPEQDEVATMDFSDEDDRFPEDMRAHEVVVSVDVHEVPVLHNWDDIESAEAAKEDACGKTFLNSRSVVTTTEVANREDKNGTEETNPSQQNVEVQGQKAEVGANNPSAMATPEKVKNSNAESLSGELQRTIGAIKTAVMVHDETNLEALECSEDLLQSVATEADFPSDIYENADDDTDGGIGDTNGEQPATGLRAVSDDVLITHKDLRVSPEKHDCLNQVDASKEVKQRGEDTEEQRKSSSTDTVEGMKVPDHIRSPSNKSSTESESVSQEQHIVSNGGLKYAVEDFIRLISSDGNDIQTSKKKGDEKSRIHDAADDNVDAEAGEAQGGEKNGEHKAADDKEGRKADKDDQEDSLKTDSSESFDLSAAGAGDIDSGSRKVKENTTHNVTEAVEQSERTEGGATGDRVRSTRIFQKTIKRTESTRTVRKTRSFLPYTKWIRGETRQRDRQETRDEDDAMEPVEEALVVPYQSFPAMSIPRMGLCPMPESSPGNVCSVAVQAFPSVVDQGVQVEFDEPDCITRLVELQIAMNEQEEVRRQDMKAACELVEKLEAMQLSESLMRTQLRAMDAERREQSAREARLRDELTAWQETVQQQQLLLQQLKEDLDDTEDTLAAQRQEANRLREQMLVLQESCDSSLLMVDVLGRADKEVQTPDGGQQSLSSSSPYKGIRLENSSPMYLDQLSQHRRLSALVSSQLEATANRIAQLRREAAVNRPRGSTIDDYVQDLAEKEAIVHQLLLEQRQMDELLSEHEKILAHTRSESVKSKEGQMTPTLQTEEEKLCLVGARCLHENHPDVIARQARLLQRLQVDRIGVYRTPTPIDRSSVDSGPTRRAEPMQRPYHALLTEYPVQRYGPRSSVRAATGTPATGVSGSSVGGGSDTSAGCVGSSADPRRISRSSTATTVNSRSNSAFRASQQRQLQARRPHATATTTSTAASRGHARQSQPQSGPRQPTGSSAKKTVEERVNRFVNTSREGNTSKR